MSFKFCPMCGEKVINESFKFCPECGYKFEVVDEPAEKNSLKNVNEQNLPEEIEEVDGLAKDPKLRQKQLALKAKYGKGTSSKGEDDELKDMKSESEVRRRNAERKRQEELKKMEEEKNSKKVDSRTPYGAFPCHYSEKRYNTLIGVYPEFFNGVCTIYNNRLDIQGKKRQKVIRYSNISSIEYNKSFLKGSGMVITLSGGNIIELTIREDAYYIINKLWQGDY